MASTSSANTIKMTPAQVDYFQKTALPKATAEVDKFLRQANREFCQMITTFALITIAFLGAIGVIEGEAMGWTVMGLALVDIASEMLFFSSWEQQRYAIIVSISTLVIGILGINGIDLLSAKEIGYVLLGMTGCYGLLQICAFSANLYKDSENEGKKITLYTAIHSLAILTIGILAGLGILNVETVGWTTLALGGVSLIFVFRLQTICDLPTICTVSFLVIGILGMQGIDLLTGEEMGYAMLSVYAFNRLLGLSFVTNWTIQQNMNRGSKIIDNALEDALTAIGEVAATAVV